MQRNERRMVFIKRLMYRLWESPRALPAHTLETLSPVDVKDAQFAIYESELLHSLKSSDVKNIAITGGYGAGKSSLIKSFVRRHPEYRYAFISLASFEQSRVSDNIGEKEPRKESNLEDAIEGTIVQQLLYSVPARDVPGTRLRRISYATRKSIAFKALIGFLSVIFYLRLRSSWPEYIPNISDTIEWIPERFAQISIGVVCFAAIYVLLRALSNLRIQELNLKGIKWDGGGSVSVLHKHVDEIIHLFEMVPIDVVFVEDLDRFNDKAPFVRLREINFVINSAAAIRHPVRFVYAINDELFARDERAKFFDLVVPVVPVINADNSSDMLMSLLEARVGSDIPHRQDVAQLLETVADYVGDMRQIKHLVNDFNLHRSVLRGVHAGDIRKELAMVAIRCVYPQEYAALLRGAGEIKYAFSMFPSWVQRQLAIPSKRRDDLLRISEQQGRESLQDAGEIMTIIWSEIEDLCNSNFSIELELPDIGRVNKAGFISLFEKANEILSSQSVRVISRGATVRHIDLAAMVSSGGKNYLQRITQKLRPAEPDQVELVNIERRIEELRSLTLQDALLDSSFIEEVSDYCESKELKLVPYFMRKGFLSTDYSDYIGYFYPGTISHADKAALLDIRIGKLLEPDHHLDAPSVVLGKLSAGELRAGVGMLCSIVEEILDEIADGNALRAKRLQVIFEEFEDHLERVDSLYRLIHQKGKLAALVSAVTAVQPWVSIRVAGHGAYCSSSDVRLEIISVLIQEIDPSIKASYVDGVMTLLADLTDPARLMTVDVNGHAQRWFRIKAARIDAVDDGVSKEVLFEAMRKNIIKVNLHNISTIFAMAAPHDIGKSPTYSIILAAGDESLIEFVKSDWVSYVESVYLPGFKSVETEAAFIEMVRLSLADTRAISAVMNSVQAEVHNIADLDDIVWEAAVISGKVSSTVNNILLVAQCDWKTAAEVDTIVALLIDRMDFGVLSPLPEDGEKEQKVQMLLSLFERSKGPGSSNFKKLIAKLDLARAAVAAGILDDHSADEIVGSGLPFTDENFLVLSSSFKGAALSLAKLNTQAFSDYFTRQPVGESVVAAVLSSSDVLYAKRLDVYVALTVRDIAEHKQVALESAKLLSHEVNAKTLRRIYSKEKISAIFSSLDSEQEKIRLLASILSVAPWSDFESVFETLTESGFSGILDQTTSFEVANTIENNKLLGTMSSRQWLKTVERRGTRLHAIVQLSKLK